MTAHRGQRPRCADPVDGDLWLSESLADRRYATTCAQAMPCWSSVIRRLAKHDMRRAFGLAVIEARSRAEIRRVLRLWPATLCK